MDCGVTWCNLFLDNTIQNVSNLGIFQPASFEYSRVFLVISWNTKLPLFDSLPRKPQPLADGDFLKHCCNTQLLLYSERANGFEKKLLPVAFPAVHLRVYNPVRLAHQHPHFRAWRETQCTKKHTLNIQSQPRPQNLKSNHQNWSREGKAAELWHIMMLASLWCT